MAEMSLSEVFYEAACRLSDIPRDNYDYSSLERMSCVMVEHVGCYDDACKYGDLMETEPGDITCMAVRNAAEIWVGWPVQDFRTFMLLMASEAVK